jgi:serine protease Do
VIPARADVLEITSTPSGATVEINGIARGTTPYHEDLPGGFFHRPLTAIGKRLEYPMTARITLEGYTTRDLQLTEGPKEWISLKGRNRGQYWLLSSKHFHVDLDRLSNVFTGAVDTGSATTQDALAPMASGSEDPIKQALLRARPAVVQLKGVKKSGSGFFVTATGVVATNAHLARGESSFTAILPDGRKLAAKVVDIEEHTDIALLKIDGQDFPHLLIRADLPETADTVIAIGNPAGGMAGSISKGVVSAVGKFSEAGPGTWIETDAVINPGNSGGPLLNIRGEVIGITSGRLATKNGGGLTFALCSTELRAVLDRFYHDDR